MEEKTLNRGWVKNAAIIFLCILLVLTFFSNTWLNRSLPEVATQYITSGTITTRVRGTGAVTANETYELSLDQSRKIGSVLVQVGDVVQTGDVLFTLGDASSEELEAAQKELDALRLSYQKALINATQSDYARENREIQLAREALAEAQADVDGNYVTDAQIREAEDAVQVAQANKDEQDIDVSDLQLEISQIQSELAGLNSVDTTEIKRQVEERRQQYRDAETALTVAEMTYIEDYEDMEDIANANRGTTSLEVYMQYLAYSYEQTNKVNSTTEAESEVRQMDTKNAPSITPEMYTAYTAITNAQVDLAEKKKAYEQLNEDYQAMLEGDDSALIARLNNELEDLQDDLIDGQRRQKQCDDRLSQAQKTLTDLQTRKTQYDTAVQQVKTCESNLENLLFDLQEKQKETGKTQQLEALDLEQARKDIAAQEQKVQDLSGGEGSGSEIKSSVNGIVSAINVTAGNTAVANEPIATIEVPDLGYSVSFPVTMEQSRKVRVGDSATVSNYYWGNDIQATLSAIKPDPANPQSSRLLVFDIKGEVTSGTNLTLSVGQRSAEYDCIVPNSAIRSDSNGTFVLIITAKNSPLGNRFIATRVDVTVEASDDTNTAISGGVNAYDYVITTSTKPIENGDQVRMPD